MTEHCISCGAEIPEGFKICKTCEERRKTENDAWFCRSPKKKSKTDAIIEKLDIIIKLLEKEDVK